MIYFRDVKVSIKISRRETLTRLTFVVSVRGGCPLRALAFWAQAIAVATPGGATGVARNLMDPCVIGGVWW